MKQIYKGNRYRNITGKGRRWFRRLERSSMPKENSKLLIEAKLSQATFLMILTSNMHTYWLPFFIFLYHPMPTYKSLHAMLVDLLWTNIRFRFSINYQYPG